jgi:hypothetical protein
MTFTKSNIADLKANPAFQYLLESLATELNQSERTLMKDPDPFYHGQGVGKREVIERIFADVESGLREQAEGKGQVQKLS